MGHGVWNVDGQRRDVSLHGLHWGLGRFLFLPLLAGQGSECDLDVCAREPERAPKKEKPTVSVHLPIGGQDAPPTTGCRARVSPDILEPRPAWKSRKEAHFKFTSHVTSRLMSETQRRHHMI